MQRTVSGCGCHQTRVHVHAHVRVHGSMASSAIHQNEWCRTLIRVHAPSGGLARTKDHGAADVGLPCANVSTVTKLVAHLAVLTFALLLQTQGVDHASNSSPNGNFFSPRAVPHLVGREGHRWMRATDVNKVHRAMHVSLWACACCWQRLGPCKARCPMAAMADTSHVAHGARPGSGRSTIVLMMSAMPGSKSRSALMRLLQSGVSTLAPHTVSGVGPTRHAWWCNARCPTEAMGPPTKKWPTVWQQGSSQPTTVLRRTCSCGSMCPTWVERQA